MQSNNMLRAMIYTCALQIAYAMTMVKFQNK